MPTCRICQSQFEPFISFGKMPIANGFLAPEQFDREYFFELAVGFCPTCAMVQLVDQPNKEQMFHEHYAFYSSMSRHMAEHFKRVALNIMPRYFASNDPFVVEIGSNDGVLLEHCVQRGVRHVGVEPAANVAKVAQEKGVETIVEFFDEELAGRIRSEHGQADVVFSANTMLQFSYMRSVLSGIASLLKPSGVLIFEDPYLGDIIEKTSYDQMYDEHLFYFSVASVDAMVRRHGMAVIDVESLPVHGGSMRYVVAHEGALSVSSAVAAQRAKEEQLGLRDLTTYEHLRKRIEQSRNDLVTLLSRFHDEGKRVVGYGATSKSTTILNYCNIGPDLIEFISDITPIKQGKFSPGMHIPVRSYEEFIAHYPDYALLFAWNHAREIMAKENNFHRAGGRWIVHVPKVGVLAHDFVR